MVGEIALWIFLLAIACIAIIVLVECFGYPIVQIIRDWRSRR